MLWFSLSLGNAELATFDRAHMSGIKHGTENASIQGTVFMPTALVSASIVEGRTSQNHMFVNPFVHHCTRVFEAVAKQLGCDLHSLYYRSSHCNPSAPSSPSFVHCQQRVFLVIRPNPMLHFAPFLSTHFFPRLNTIFKNGSFLSIVALVSVTLLDSNPRPSAEKRSNLAPTPSSSLVRTTTTELPECQERRGAKTI